jgi:vacuolar protein sorting-associated protein 29
MLVPNKMQHVICTGNVGREQYNELRTLAPNVHVVAGDYDEEDLGFPETQVVQVGQFRIGIMHGHQVLPYNSQEAKARMRRKLNVDIFVSGHSHQNEVVLQDGYYHINPVRVVINIMYACVVSLRGNGKFLMCANLSVIYGMLGRN